MNEHGFYHPSRGYWQTTGDVPADILATYPAGTIEVPLKPGRWFDWVNGAWQPVAEDLNELADTAKAQRNRLLLESDWTELPSVQQLHDTAWKNMWAQYRQQLRDVPSQSEFPRNIYWPIKPEN